MSELLWRCDEGASFSSEANGLQLTVVRAPSGDGFRYQLLRSRDREAGALIASGHCRELRDAIAAAERVARSFGPADRASVGPANAFAPRGGKAA